jgi:triacylglycerol esterase/lipase EstA (alpha/beta hydrolase family)
MRALRTAAVVAATLIASCALAASADARSNNRTKAVYFIHGYENGSDANCSQWNDMESKFRQWGWTGDFVEIAYYHNDVNCNNFVDHHGSHSTHFPSGHFEGSHTEDARIEHLGYHLAWHIYDHYSSAGHYVDVVAHSMGGLIIRYAIAQVQRNNPQFPPLLRVEDVVTMGTPHGGARFAGLCIINCNTQVQQMKAGSDLLVWLENNAWEPDGTGGTDWSTFGSDDDNQVAADRAVGSDHDRSPIQKYFGSCHKTWYTTESNIEHTDFLHDTQEGFTATAFAFHNCAGGWNLWSLPWPVRRADLALFSGGE